MRIAASIVLSCAALASLSGCSINLGALPDDAPLFPRAVDTEDGFWVDGRVALIEISGTIQNSRPQGLLSVGENPVSTLHEKLEAARKDPSVKAVILRLNTPGGTVTASDAMYREVLRFKKLSGKPVIALMMDVAASGGYYVACAADHIVAYPTTITGSVGVIMQTISFKRGLNMIGIDPEALTSGPNKALGSPLDTLSPEHRKILQDLVDRFYQRFRGIVREARPKIPADQFDTVTDGRVFTGKQALEIGLVDANGDLYDAFAAAKQRANLKKAHLIRYLRGGRGGRTAYAASPAPAPGMTQINLAQFNLGGALPGDGTDVFLYLWRP